MSKIPSKLTGNVYDCLEENQDSIKSETSLKPQKSVTFKKEKHHKSSKRATKKKKKRKKKLQRKSDDSSSATSESESSAIDSDNSEN